jgi:Ni,Fe-hydrogenase III small subunit/ferredoxin
MPWIPRGLRESVVTTRYPHKSDDYGTGFRAAIEVRIAGATPDQLEAAVRACPTGAISLEQGRPFLDRGACILCGRCTELAPSVFQFDSNFETAKRERSGLVVPYREETDTSLASAREELAARVRSLRRSVHIRHVDAGSDGSDDWEVAALTNPVYDVQRLGIFFTASPRHADVLLVTGVGSAGMIGPLQHTWEVMPHPKLVIAAGVDAISGGLIGSGYAARGGVASSVPVDVFVPGSPASPFSLLHGILMALKQWPTFKSETAENRATGPDLEYEENA